MHSTPSITKCILHKSMFGLLMWSNSGSCCISFFLHSIVLCESLKWIKFYFVCDLFCLRSHFGHIPDLKQILLKKKRNYLRFVLTKKALTVELYCLGSGHVGLEKPKLYSHEHDSNSIISRTWLISFSSILQELSHRCNIWKLSPTFSVHLS